MTNNQMQLIEEENKEVAFQQDGPDIFTIIGQAASDPNFDASKMQALIDMREQMEGAEAKKKFMSAMVNFSEMKPRIIKNKEGHNNKYASLDSIIRQIRQPLFECGLNYNWITETVENKTKVTCILSHVEGHSIESSMEAIADKSGNKSDLHGAGSTISYLQRYTLKSVLGLVEEGEDDDGTKAKLSQPISDEQSEEIDKLISETGVDLPAFCKVFKIGAIKEMSVSQYGLAIKQLNAKKRAMK